MPVMLRFVILSFVTVVSLTLASCASEGSSLTYLSLGDSLAVGVGSSDPTRLGYAPLFEASLEENTNREVDLVQLGVSGETSESFIGSYPDPEASQLARATNILEENPNAVVTLSLGANDLLGVMDASRSGRERAIEEYGANLDRILTELDSASEGRASISVLTLYNPVPGSFTDEWTKRLNAEIKSVAERHGATVADGYEAFRGRESEYINLPEDFHPTDAGYEALARAIRNSSPEQAIRPAPE